MVFLITSVSGFVTLFLVLLTLALPYVLRARARAAGSHMAAISRRMQAHYWIGYAILALTTLHMFLSMQAGMARGTSALGLDLASLGLLLIALQVMLGINLKAVAGIGKTGLRRVHFVTMLAIVALVAVHLALNSALLQELTRS